MISIAKDMKFTYLKSQPHLPGDIELRGQKIGKMDTQVKVLQYLSGIKY